MKLKYGMIGGGIGSLIGAAHRDAAAATGRFELVCGCFSSDATKSHATGQMLGLDASRVYDHWETMLNSETNLDAVVIVTPNHLHFGPAQLALSKGVHVIVDKPMTWSMEEAVALKKMVEETNLVFAVTYTHAGYAVVGHMREFIASGMLGDVKKVHVEYLQGWMSENADADFKRHAAWRMDPSKSGISCAAADIGVHVFFLAEYVTGSKVTGICSMLNSVVEGHALDDDATALLKFDNGATGTLIASQIATGEGNHLRLRVYGDKAAIEWNRSNPDVVTVKFPDMSVKYLHGGELSDDDPSQRLGSPRITIEAFTVIYDRVAHAIAHHKAGEYHGFAGTYFPNVEDGYRGMQFIEAAVSSSANGSTWYDIE
jgi:predicted dehydrogenase